MQCLLHTASRAQCSDAAGRADASHEGLVQAGWSAGPLMAGGGMAFVTGVLFALVR